MRVLIDKNIPFIKGLIDGVAEVVYLEPSAFTPDTVKNADVLIIRTRTRCDEALLSGSAVKFIATATIGYDHIDTDYCKKAGIAWTNAPGCNADSVCNYIDAAIRYVLPDFEGKTIGIVGVGNVGSRVYKNALAMGMKPLLNDPPLQQSGCMQFKFTPLESIAAEADIITFHVPLNADTYHIINAEFLSVCRPGAIIINSSRGEILSTDDALKATQKFVIDCWENEPSPNLQLLSKALLATPHIAGYSIDGKANGTVASVNAVSDFFGLGIKVSVNDLGLPPKDYTAKYNIEADSIALKREPHKFEWFRNHYPVRRDLIS
ncbi:MAG: 4-phosphoerythronate dehydrogenase [Paludibacteraceae bacterium]|nr:4-phosphoerythronate dehydrogenase [Paludibacteraceae bacterium]